MWVLKSEKTGDIFYIVGKESYNIGRNNCDLTLNNDTSISRSHASLYLNKDSIKMIDNGSKYGTYIRDNIEKKICLEKNKAVLLNDGDRIMFGVLENIWYLSKVNICTTISTLTIDNKENLKQMLSYMNGVVVDSWSKNCTHLTMNELTVTLKVLHALTANIPIVSLKYWETYMHSVKTQKALPNYKEFLPKLTESFLNEEDVSFDIKKNRKTIFSGKKFVFMAKNTMQKYRQIIINAGGEYADLNKRTKKTSLIEKDVIIIQYIPLSQTQCSQALDSVSEYIKSHGRRLVPESEIGLAILHCSTRKYCNPDYNIKNEFISKSQSEAILKSHILEKNTPFEYSYPPKQSETKSISVDVPESVDYAILDVNSQVNNKFTEENSNIRHNNNDIEANMLPSTSQDETYWKLKRKNENQPNLENIKRICTGTENLPTKDNINKTSCESQFSNLNINTFLKKNKIPRTLSIEDEPLLLPEALRNTEKQKRPRLAIIDSDNDDEDDLFVFGTNLSQPVKRFKTHLLNQNNQKSDENEQKHSQCKTSFPTELVVMSKSKNSTEKEAKPTPKPIKIPTEGWLYKSIKSTKINNEDIKNSNDWISSIKGGFEVKIRHMKLVSRSFQENSLRNATNNDSSINTTKNFKVFVKKFNYKPQKEVICTVPHHVGIKLHTML